MERITEAIARALLPERPDDAYKDIFGRALIVAGSLQYPGAGSLASGGAARIGAGVVTLAIGRSALIGPGRLPEVTLEVLTEAEFGYLGLTAADELAERFDDYDALLIGPGIGRGDSMSMFLKRALRIDGARERTGIGFRLGSPQGKQAPAIELPTTVLDADALTLLGQIDGWWERLPRGRCVLTPHPGEMRALLGCERLDDDLGRIARDSAARWGQVVVLKSSTVWIADPSGRCLVHDQPNATLATAGTGDVLAGAITGLIAQGLDGFAASTLAVYLHRAAGRMVRESIGDAGMLAGDLLPVLPLAMKELKKVGR